VNRNAPSTRFREVVHLVRDPLKSVDSRYNGGHIDNFEKYHKCNVDTSSVPASNALAVTLHHWVAWNLFVEATSSKRLRIEDFVADPANVGRSLCADLLKGRLNNGTWYDATPCPSDEHFTLAASRLSPNDHSNHTVKVGGFTWITLYEQDPQTTQMAQLMALRYGYDIHQEELYVDPMKHKESCTFNNDGRWRCQLVSVLLPEEALS